MTTARSARLSAQFQPATVLPRAYELLLAAYGPQHWWPAESPFEVCVGAILTQNTSWTNVERAIAALKRAGRLSVAGIYTLTLPELAGLIRPAGYFNVKARRLKEFVRILQQDFGGRLERLFAGSLGEVRNRLLAISGIGPETADSMLLYAGGHASFVVDAYTRRVFARHGWCHPKASYDDLKALCETALNNRTPDQLPGYWGDYHAQIVRVAKIHCRKAAPRCEGCPLEPLLPRAARGPAGRRPSPRHGSSAAAFRRSQTSPFPQP